MDSMSRLSLTNARFNFALDSMKEMTLIESKDNIFFSPHSIHMALSLAYFGARGTTEDSLKRALQIPNELSKIEVQRFYAIEKSLNQMRSQVSDSSPVRLRNYVIYLIVTGGMSRWPSRSLLLHQRPGINHVLGYSRP